MEDETAGRVIIFLVTLESRLTLNIAACSCLTGSKVSQGNKCGAGLGVAAYAVIDRGVREVESE